MRRWRGPWAASSFELISDCSGRGGFSGALLRYSVLPHDAQYSHYLTLELKFPVSRPLDFMLSFGYAHHSIFIALVSHGKYNLYITGVANAWGETPTLRTFTA